MLTITALFQLSANNQSFKQNQIFANQKKPFVLILYAKSLPVSGKIQTSSKQKQLKLFNLSQLYVPLSAII